jgi:DNA-binding transcriptional ArsR family regulator
MPPVHNRHAKVVSLTTDTGERMTVSSQREPSRSYGRMFHTTFDDAAAELAKAVRSGVTLRLFLILPRHLSYTDFRKLDQRKLGKELDAGQSSISRALEELREIGAVEKRGSGAHIEWRLTSDYGWRGTVESYHQDRRLRGRAAPEPRTPAEVNAAEGLLWKAKPWTATARSPIG